MVRSLIAIGSNTGDCQEHIRQAVERIKQVPTTDVLAVSSLLETQPVGSDANQVFLNGAVLLETAQPAELLIKHLLRIENEGGRDRSTGSGNRPIDLDILLYGSQIINRPELEVPHPRMTFRRFVLQPAVEIAGDFKHPIAKQTLQELLDCLHKQRNIIVVHAPSRHSFKRMQQKVSQQLKDGSDEEQAVHWCFDEERRDVLRSMRQALIVERHWWVLVVESPTDSLSFAADAAKLKVYPSEKSSESGISVPPTSQLKDSAGPYWCLQHEEPEQIIEIIETAIQSMLPLGP